MSAASHYADALAGAVVIDIAERVPDTLRASMGRAAWTALEDGLRTLEVASDKD